jgi:tRNA threonylcarbamoyladenosine biosynthesis protein TsaB
VLLLITDTSGRNGIVAVARALQASKQDQIQILESVPLAGGTFSAQLVPQIAALLEKHGLSKSQIDAFVVVSGPGSFTGLRVGLAAIKALAEILQKPIVPVSFLEVVARAAGIDGRIIALLDAGRGQLYSGEYEISGGARAQLIQEHLIAREALPDLSRAVAISTPDATLAGLSREAGLRTFELKAIPPEVIAVLGWSKLCDGEIASPEQLDANYVRCSDQIFGTPSSATPQPSTSKP